MQQEPIPEGNAQLRPDDHPQHVTLPCADCGTPFIPAITKTKICLTCLSKKNDISDGIPRQLNMQWCRYCRKYFGGSQWILCDRESKELLAMCLKKVTGLKFMKLMDAHFLWTEAHSKRLKVRLTVRKEVSGQVTLEQTFDVEFTEVYTQCDDCKREFTPHTWKAMVQVRQRADSKRTFLYLEQLLLKVGLHKKCLKITSMPEGMDFFFRNKANAQALVDYIDSLFPTIKRESKELVSHNSKNNTYNYKYTMYVELPRVCKDDLVVLPKKLCKEAVGGANALAVCYKVGTRIHLFDPVTFKIFELNGNVWFNHEADIKVIPFRSNETEFYVVDIYRDEGKKAQFTNSFSNIEIRFAHLVVRRASDNKEFTCVTQMGHILKHGDTVLGYDMSSLACEELSNMDNQKYLPDVLVMRKTYPKGERIWKLERMEVEEGLEVKNPSKKQKQAAKLGDKDLQDFYEEIEQNKGIRTKINLYRNEEVISKRQRKHKEAEERKQLTKDTPQPQTAMEEETDQFDETEHREAVKLTELMANLKLEDDAQGEDFGELEDMVDKM